MVSFGFGGLQRRSLAAETCGHYSAEPIWVLCLVGCVPLPAARAPWLVGMLAVAMQRIQDGQRARAVGSEPLFLVGLAAHHACAVQDVPTFLFDSSFAYSGKYQK